jgi:hypothetical protein
VVLFAIVWGSNFRSGSVLVIVKGNDDDDWLQKKLDSTTDLLDERNDSITAAAQEVRRKTFFHLIICFSMLLKTGRVTAIPYRAGHEPHQLRL